MMGNSSLISDLSKSKVYPAGSGKKPAKSEKPEKSFIAGRGAGPQALLNPNSVVGRGIAPSNPLLRR